MDGKQVLCARVPLAALPAAKRCPSEPFSNAGVRYPADTPTARRPCLGSSSLSVALEGAACRSKKRLNLCR
jgi:hypothetical protein